MRRFKLGDKLKFSEQPKDWSKSDTIIDIFFISYLNEEGDVNPIDVDDHDMTVCIVYLYKNIELKDTHWGINSNMVRPFLNLNSKINIRYNKRSIDV